MEPNHKNNITAWVSDAQKNAWDKMRLKESANPNHPVGWSTWIATKVNMAVNAQSLPETPENNAVESAHLNKQIHKLQYRIRELESREIGVSDTRILRILSEEYTDFNTIVQKLIDTEMEAAYQAIQRLAADGEVECDADGKKWRLKQ
jgi:hypothetical protein